MLSLLLMVASAFVIRGISVAICEVKTANSVNNFDPAIPSREVPPPPTSGRKQISTSNVEDPALAFGQAAFGALKVNDEFARSMAALIGARLNHALALSSAAKDARGTPLHQISPSPHYNGYAEIISYQIIGAYKKRDCAVVVRFWSRPDIASGLDSRKVSILLQNAFRRRLDSTTDGVMFSA